MQLDIWPDIQLDILSKHRALWLGLAAPVHTRKKTEKTLLTAIKNQNNATAPDNMGTVLEKTSALYRVFEAVLMHFELILPDFERF